MLVSTMKALIGPGLPLLPGVRAITTISSAIVPFVHHSFSPFRMYALPSAVGVAVVLMRAGSDPTSTSVSANAEIAPWREPRQQALLLLLGAEHLERLRHADRLVRREQRDHRAAAACRPDAIARP